MCAVKLEHGHSFFRQRRLKQSSPFRRMLENIIWSKLRFVFIHKIFEQVHGFCQNFFGGQGDDSDMLGSSVLCKSSAWHSDDSGFSQQVVDEVRIGALAVDGRKNVKSALGLDTPETFQDIESGYHQIGLFFDVCHHIAGMGHIPFEGGLDSPLHGGVGT